MHKYTGLRWRVTNTRLVLGKPLLANLFSRWRQTMPTGWPPQSPIPGGSSGCTSKPWWPWPGTAAVVSSRSISRERSPSCLRTRAPPIPAMAVSPSPRCPPPPPTLPEEATLRRLPSLVVSLCTANSAHQQCLSINSCIILIKCKVLLKCSLHHGFIDHTYMSSMKNCHLRHFSNRSINKRK